MQERIGEAAVMLEEFPVIVSAEVRWGDQDAFGHVNNAMYFRWAESARIEYLIRIGMWQRMERERVGPILAAITCNFRRALTYPDVVTVGARITEVGNTSFRMAHRMFSENQQAVAAELESTLVLFDYNAGKPVPIPEETRRAIEEVEKS